MSDEEMGRTVHDELISILPRIRRFAVSLTGRQGDADDLLQMVVERILKNGIPEGAHLLKWSFRICRNLWIDEIRARKVRSHVPVEDVSYGLAGEDGEKTAMAKLTLKDVDAALQKLPENQRAAICLVSVEGFSYAEAAETLKVPIGTIMSRVSRARQTLSAIFYPPEAMAGA